VFISKPLFSKALDLGFWNHPAAAEFHGVYLAGGYQFIERCPTNLKSETGGFYAVDSWGWDSGSDSVTSSACAAWWWWESG
jgi:hypothetical protein